MSCFFSKRRTDPVSRTVRINPAIVALIVLATHGAAAAGDLAVAQSNNFKTRGVVLIPADLSLADWPERAAKAGLTTIALHHGDSPQKVVEFILSASGKRFLKECERLGLNVEYELHAMRELLPRSLFTSEPTVFRMNEKGVRTPDANLCINSSRALEIVASNAVALARQLKPTTGRFFFWGDDGAPWCRCAKCRDLSDSDQALAMENALIRELRRTIDPKAQLAHLAYANTLAAPTSIKPEPGVFLEFAPINRRYDLPYEQQKGPEAKDALSLESNLRVFPSDTAQVLEYWLDVSRFSKWKRPAVQLPLRANLISADARTYAKLGIRHITTFAVWIDSDYVKHFGEPAAIEEYGHALQWQ